MSRLIDADVMRDEWLYESGTFEPNDVLGSIDCQPTVDAVQVVRCKECKHYDGKWCLLLDMVNSDMGDWFCAYGERKNNETKLKGE